MSSQNFAFRFTAPYRLAALPFGVRPATAEVTVTVGRLLARFGPWRVDVALANIVDATITGPYGFLKTAGPAHLSFSDRGLTMATNGDRGVCVTFREPVGGIDPRGWIRHPNLTLTVADCDGLRAALSAS